MLAAKQQARHRVAGGAPEPHGQPDPPAPGRGAGHALPLGAVLRVRGQHRRWLPGRLTGPERGADRVRSPVRQGQLRRGRGLHARGRQARHVRLQRERHDVRGGRPVDGGGRAKGFFVVLKVFAGYRACASQPDGWHQYSPGRPDRPAERLSTSISPGFFKGGEATPRLARDLPAFRQAVRDMVASGRAVAAARQLQRVGRGLADRGGAAVRHELHHGAVRGAALTPRPAAGRRARPAITGPAG